MRRTPVVRQGATRLRAAVLVLLVAAGCADRHPPDSGDAADVPGDDARDDGVADLPDEDPDVAAVDSRPDEPFDAPGPDDVGPGWECPLDVMATVPACEPSTPPACDPAFTAAAAGLRCSAAEFEILPQTERTDRVAIAALEDGGFAVTYPAVVGDPPRAVARVSLLGCDGGPRGEPFDVIEGFLERYPAAADPVPVVAGLSDGTFVVAWSLSSGQPDETGLRGRVFSPEGQGGAEFRVNQPGTGPFTFPAVAALSDGGFVIAGYGIDGDRLGYSMGVYGPGGASRRPVVPLPAEPDAGVAVAAPAVAGLPDGGFVAAWTAGPPLAKRAIRAQRFTRDGDATGDRIAVSDAPEHDNVEPSIAVLPSGEFLVAWTGGCTTPPPMSDLPPCIGGMDGSFQGVFGRWFGPDGSALGDRFRLNDYTPNVQASARLALVAPDRVVATWTQTCDLWTAPCDWPDGGTWGARAALDLHPGAKSPEVGPACLPGGGGPSDVAARVGGPLLMAWWNDCADVGARARPVGRLCVPAAPFPP